MKLCMNCGTPNWEMITDEKGNPVCSECGSRLIQTASCSPVLGVPIGSGGYRIIPTRKYED